jgi:hypothetical protein
VNRGEVYGAIDAERDRQRTLWAGKHDWGQGDCSSPSVKPTTKAAVLLEEAGEVARAVLDQDIVELRRKLVQVAAVAVAWLEGLG